MKATRLIGALLVAGCMAGAALGQDALKETAVLATLKQKYPSTTFKSVSTTTMPGIYEVVMGKNVAYVEEGGRYFIFGHLFDMQTQTDLTEGKVGDVNPKADFKALPLKDAVVTVRGDGSRKLAIFSDPDCPYCKQLERNIAGMTNITVYTFIFPIEQLHPQAMAKSIGVWCAPDRGKAWENLMQKGEAPPVATCDNPIQRNIALAESLGINGTPTVVLPDGAMIPGAASAAKLEQLLAAAAGKVASK